jgi:thiol-disulfide isomerase/thioredoxin
MSSKTKKDTGKSSIPSKKVKKVKNISSSIKALSKHDNIDVKKLEDVAKLVEHIKSNVVTLLLVYADWCGHCKTFKKDVWDKLASLKGRKVNIAQLNESQLANSPFSGLKIDGYPTVSLIGKDMKPATLTDPKSGESTNALPNTRDMTAMTNLVKANPNQVVANNGMSQEERPQSARPTAESAKALEKAGNEALENMNNGRSNIPKDATATVPNPPNVEDDVVATMTPPIMNENNTTNNTANKSKTPKVGGSLYASLLEATRQIAAPVILATTAAALTRRARGKGTKKLRGRARK